MSTLRTLGALGLVVLPLSSPSRAAGPVLPDVLEERLLAIEALVGEPGEEALEAFCDDHVASTWIERAGRPAVLAKLDEIRERCRNFGGIAMQPLGGDRARMSFENALGRWHVTVELEPTDERRIGALSLEPAPSRPTIPPFTWDDVEERLEAYEAQGFAGSVLLVREGEVVLHRGYGLADPERGVKNTPNTIFAIGSTPIDFTKAAILWLEERGRLDTSERLSTYLPNVPEDKQAITLEHLMTGRSGLVNFHGIRGVDENLDLSWIDRDEALRRIFQSPLLFEPGTGREHSHSAWGVLAAVVEVVSGQSYGAFCREHLFEPAGMERTGLYPHTQGFDPSEVAVGHGVRTFGQESSPRHWGETSWLVMGSGGMVSTTVDLERWLRALHAGRILSPESLRRYWTGEALSGGNDRGFLCCYNEGPDDLAIVCSNSNAVDDPLAKQVGMALVDLAMRGGAPPRFSIGLVATVDGDRVVIDSVVPQSAAAEAGLRAGDVVLAVDGAAPALFEPRLLAAARTGAPLRLTVERDGREVEIAIEPRARE